MTKIQIKESIEDKSSHFNIKRFRIGNKKFELPIKTIDLRNTNKGLYQQYIQNTGNIFEKSKLIKKPQQIESVLNADDESRVNDFFQSKKWAEDNFNFMSITMNFLPSNKTISEKQFQPFLDYYYTYSKNMLLVPNLSKKATQDVDTIKYFVKRTYDYLNSMNSKPIFVPVSINLGMGKLQDLLSFYIRNEFFYWWFDFEGKSINQNTIARVRRAIILAKENGYFDKIVLYYTNIKREITSNIGDNESGASDILASLGGANIIGANREPQRYNPNQTIENKPSAAEIWRHKARRFDGETYLYKKFEGQIEKPPLNFTLNSVRLQSELKNQTEEFLRRLEIQKYIRKKQATQLYPEIYNKLLSN